MGAQGPTGAQGQAGAAGATGPQGAPGQGTTTIVATGADKVNYVNLDPLATPGTVEFICRGQGAATYDIINITMRLHHLG